MANQPSKGAKLQLLVGWWRISELLVPNDAAVTWLPPSKDNSLLHSPSMQICWRLQKNRSDDTDQGKHNNPWDGAGSKPHPN